MHRRIARVDNIVIEIKQLMKSVNGTNYPKRRREHARQGKKGDPLGIVQETKIFCKKSSANAGGKKTFKRVKL